MNNVNFCGHSDADMMEIGNGDLTLAERRSHMAFWVAMKSPLILGTNLEKLSDENLKLLKNEFLLAFHQDKVFGEPAKPWKWGTNADVSVVFHSATRA
jgi:alpha-galactosidase